MLKIEIHKCRSKLDDKEWIQLISMFVNESFAISQLEIG